MSFTVATEELTLDTYDDVRVGQFLSLAPAAGGATVGVRVDRVERNRITVYIADPPPKGQRWNLRPLPHGTPFLLGGLPYTKVGGTTRTLRLRPDRDGTA